MRIKVEVAYNYERPRHEMTIKKIRGQKRNDITLQSTKTGFTRE